MIEVTSKILKTAYPPRAKWNHKGQHGKLLVVAGSRMYTGSAVFNCMSALRAGVDLVHLYACRRAADIAAGYAPDIITMPFEGNELDVQNAMEVVKLLPNYDALVIGGGLGPKEETARAVRLILKDCKIPAVVDADAIRALKGETSLLKGKKFVLTPHANEFVELGGKKVGSNLSLRVNEIRRVAKATRSVILLKGAIDVISDGNKVFQNNTGSPYMTKGGGGDCLAGICGALLCRGLSTIDSACASAYINGLAGEIACSRLKDGYIASDLFHGIPLAISGVDTGK